VLTPRLPLLANKLRLESASLGLSAQENLDPVATPLKAAQPVSERY
jgi:hypothetical protein